MTQAGRLRLDKAEHSLRKWRLNFKLNFDVSPAGPPAGLRLCRGILSTNPARDELGPGPGTRRPARGGDSEPRREPDLEEPEPEGRFQA
eukprot:3597339-Rhodomonas_salina.2